MRIVPVIERLKAECPVLSGRVDWPQSTLATGDLSDTPAAWVWWAVIDGDPSRPIPVRQRLNTIIQVLVVAQGVTLDGTSEPLADAIDQINRALIGWIPGDAALAPLQFVNAEIDDIVGDLYRVNLYYKTNHYHDSVNN